MNSATVARAAVLELALLAAFVAVAVTFRLVATILAPVTTAPLILTSIAALIILTGIASFLPILARGVGAVTFGHHDYVIHEIRCCLSGDSHYQAQSRQSKNPAMSCRHRGLHFRGCLFRFHASQSG